MGFTTPLKPMFSFIYKSKFDNGLTEHEFDNVLLGYYDKQPFINTIEVSEWKWMSLDKIILEIKNKPEDFTVWFKIIFERFYLFISNFIIIYDKIYYNPEIGLISIYRFLNKKKFFLVDSYSYGGLLS